MKKIFTLLALLISLGLTSEIIATNLQVASTATGFTSIDGKGVATFVVKSPVAQSCDLSFLMMPGEYEDGSFTSVTLKVNGVTLPNPITFNTYGWQPANTTGNAVTLNEGDNIVQFISGRDDVPIVREVKVADGTRRTFPIQNLSASFLSLGNEYNNSRSIDEENYNETMYKPGVDEWRKYCYTTSIDIYYEQRYTSDNDPLPIIAHFYAPTSGDPLFGQYESTIDYNGYLFYKSDPSVYSKRFSTINHYVIWQDTLPIAGEYCLILEPKNTNEEGYASIRINNSNFYRNCYIMQDRPIKIEKILPGQNMITNIANVFYNMFTTNNWSRNPDATHTPDPALWLKQRIITGVDTSDIIVAYSDNNTVRSGFDWGNNARIRILLNPDNEYYLTLTSALPYIQSSNPDICDVYHSKLIQDPTRMPNLIPEDAINSRGGIILDPDYNCYAWSAGSNSKQISPSFPNEDNILWFDSLYNNVRVHSKGGYFQRDRNLVRCTRDGADSTNAIIAIWGDIRPDGSYYIRHAAIKNNQYDGVPRGYDWESKDFMFSQFFHPRDAISGADSINGYGQILEYYRPIVDDFTMTSSQRVYNRQIEEEIIYESVSITEEDLTIINNIISSIPLTQENKFDLLYDKWKKYSSQQRGLSSIWDLKKSYLYQDLLATMQEIENGEYIAYKKFAEGDIFSMLLIEDYAKSNKVAKEEWDNIFYNESPQQVKRTQQSEVNIFIKNIIAIQNNESINNNDISLNKSDAFRVFISNNNLNIIVNIEEVSTYRIEVIDLSNNYIQTVVPEIRVQAGEYEHIVNVPSGNYIVAYYLNGNLYSKKLTIK